MKKYLNAGNSVDIVDNLTTGFQENIDKRARFFKMDILDRELEDVIHENKYDIINHHAAQINVRKSVADPSFDIEVNYKGSAKLADLAVKHGVKHFIFASSGGAIYGEQKKYPADENHPKNPICPYGINKLAVEYYLYYKNFIDGLNYTVLRYSNVYGPRQNHECEAGVVAIFINKMLNGNNAEIFGSGEQTRDFVFVDDVAELNLKVTKIKLKGNFNISTSVETSVNRIYEVLAEILKCEKKPLYKSPKDGEIFRSCINFDLVRGKTGWFPKVEINEGLEKTVNYFKELKN